MIFHVFRVLFVALMAAGVVFIGCEEEGDHEIVWRCSICWSMR